MGAEDPQQLSKSQMKRRKIKAKADAKTKALVAPPGPASTAEPPGPAFTAAPPGPAFIAAKKTNAKAPASE